MLEKHRWFPSQSAKRRVAFGLVAAAMMILPGIVSAQPNTGIMPPASADVTFLVPDTTAALGSNFELQIDVASAEDIYFLDTVVQCDASQVQITGFEPGAGLQSYIDLNGPLSCDASVSPDGLWVLMLFIAPFDTDLYGTDFLRVQCQVVATAPGTTEMTVSSGLNPTVETATVTLVQTEESFTRGDANGDQTCNLLDAVKVLRHLFQGEQLPCHDAADVDDNGVLNLQDPIRQLNGLFLGQPMDESCGLDITPDSLTCGAGMSCP